MLENLIGTPILSEDGDDIGTITGFLCLNGYLSIVSDIKMVDGDEPGGGEEVPEDNIVELVSAV
jgi:hypothetical protein